jgi:thioredoxin
MKRLVIFTAMIFLSIGTIWACGNEPEKATVIELTSEEFSKKIDDLKDEAFIYLGDKPAIVDFNAIWCGPCRRIAPILEELAAEYDGQIVIYKVDVDKCPDAANAFGIQSIPAILYIPTDAEPQMTIGSRTKAQFQKEINTILLNK